MLGGSALAQGIERALRTLRGTYVPPDVRTPSGTWQASDETVQRANQAQTLLNEGVPVMARQVNKDPGMLPTDAPWSGASGDLGNQQQAYRRAALAKVTGQGNGSSTTAPSMATDAFVLAQGARIGGNFQAVANRNDIDFAGNLAPQLTSLGTELSGVDPATRQAIVPYLRTVTQSVSRDPITGAPIITGQKYLDLTNSNSPLQTLAGSDGLPAQYAQRIISMLHDGLAASASPADQALLTASRQQYRALQAVKAARGSDGSFQPDDLFGATEAQSKRYGGSSGTLDPLAKAGTTVLQPSYGGGAGRAAVGIGASAWNRGGAGWHSSRNSDDGSKRSAWAAWGAGRAWHSQPAWRVLDCHWLCKRRTEIPRWWRGRSAHCRAPQTSRPMRCRVRSLLRVWLLPSSSARASPPPHNIAHDGDEAQHGVADDDECNQGADRHGPGYIDKDAHGNNAKESRSCCPGGDRGRRCQGPQSDEKQHDY